MNKENQLIVAIDEVLLETEVENVEEALAEIENVADLETESEVDPVKEKGVEAEIESGVGVDPEIENEAEVGHVIVDVIEVVVEIEVEVLESSLLVLVNHLKPLLQIGNIFFFLKC